MSRTHSSTGSSEPSLSATQFEDAPVALQRSASQLSIRSPYRTVPEAAEHVRCGSIKSFRHWVKRQGILPYKRGRVLLYRLEDLDDALVGRYSATKAIERRFPKLVKRGSR